MRSYRKCIKYVALSQSQNLFGNSGIKAFFIDNINIVVNKESIMSILGENVICVSMDDFLKRPMKSIKKLLKKVKDK